MPTARANCEAAAIGNFIYVEGGSGGLDTGTANEVYGFDPVTTTTKITVDNPDPSHALQPFTVGFVVTSTGGIPSGVVTVTVSGSSAACSSLLINGAGSCALTIGAIGTYTLTANYPGEQIYLGSDDIETHTIDEFQDSLPLITME
jgi:hypothetical protein